MGNAAAHVCRAITACRRRNGECRDSERDGDVPPPDRLHPHPPQTAFTACLCPQELVKHTHEASDKSNLRLALDAMKVRTRAGHAPFPSMLGLTEDASGCACVWAVAAGEMRTDHLRVFKNQSVCVCPLLAEA